MNYSYTKEINLSLLDRLKLILTGKLQIVFEMKSSNVTYQRYKKEKAWSRF